MSPRHKTKAITGVSLWFLLFIAFPIFLGAMDRSNPSESVIGSVFGGWILATAACFLWAGYHLAKGKGYPTALLLTGILGPCLQLLMLVVLLVLPDKTTNSANFAMPRHSSRRRESSVERTVRYRRNAMLGNVFGLLGILAGIKFVVLPTGLFGDWDDEAGVGVIIFLCGYSAVITGCWWWAKAKGWPEAIVFIGLSPLVVFFIPFVRLIFINAPQLLSIPMVMMPLILLVIMLVLPDKSGMPKRKNW